MNVHQQKPALDDAIEHYGVKGMKWGVRRSEAQLAKARIRRKGGSTSSKSAWNASRSSKEIRRARRNISGQKKEIHKSAKRVVDAKNPQEKAEAQKQLKSQTKKMLTDNDYPISAQMTVGEAIATSLVLTPAAGAVGYMGTRLIGSQKRQNARNHILNADFMEGKTYSEVEKASRAAIERDSRR